MKNGMAWIIAMIVVATLALMFQAKVHTNRIITAVETAAPTAPSTPTPSRRLEEVTTGRANVHVVHRGMRCELINRQHICITAFWAD